MSTKQATPPNPAGKEGKPISLAPLSTTEALRGLLQVKRVKSAEVKRAAKNRRAKKAGKKK